MDATEAILSLNASADEFQARVSDIIGYGDDLRHTLIGTAIQHAYHDDLDARAGRFVQNSIVWSDSDTVPQTTLEAIDAHAAFWASTEVLRRAIAAATKFADSGIATPTVTDSFDPDIMRRAQLQWRADVRRATDAIRAELGLAAPIPEPHVMSEDEAEAYLGSLGVSADAI